MKKIPVNLSDPAFVPIPKEESLESYRRMERFVEDVNEADVRERLAIVIQGKGAFRRFKDVLPGFPDLEKAWHHKEEAYSLERARQWLGELGIESDWTPPEPEGAAEGNQQEGSHAGVGLEHVLALGALEGRTEIIDGRVERDIVLSSDADARRIQRRVVRQLAEWNGLSYRKSMLDSPYFEAGAIRISRDGSRVVASEAVPREVAAFFFRR